MASKLNPPPIAAVIASATSYTASATAADAAPAANKTAAKPDTGWTIDDVVVTSHKRQEDIQSVPVVITALSGKALRQNAVQTLEDVRFHAPALQVSPASFGPSIPSVSIRGERQLGSLIS